MGSVTREEHLIQVSIEDESSMPNKELPADLAADLHNNWFPNYVFLIPPQQTENIAGWESHIVLNAQEGSNVIPLAISEITSEVKTCQK